MPNKGFISQLKKFSKSHFKKLDDELEKRIKENK